MGLPLLFLMVLLASGIWELDGAERFALSRSLPTERVPSVALARANRSAMASGGDATIVAFRDGADDASGSRTESAPWLAPGLKAASHIAMCIIMGYMLIVML